MHFKSVIWHHDWKFKEIFISTCIYKVYYQNKIVEQIFHISKEQQTKIYILHKNICNPRFWFAVANKCNNFKNMENPQYIEHVWSPLTIHLKLVLELQSVKILVLHIISYNMRQHYRCSRQVSHIFLRYGYQHYTWKENSQDFLLRDECINVAKQL